MLNGFLQPSPVVSTFIYEKEDIKDTSKSLISFATSKPCARLFT